ncbi:MULTISPECIES: hypothetical protein [Acetobacter]|uniref:Uncharacterized protein n=1 Tax=Acetobacter oryzifermentans TaxID=1633874 RepID=A0ABN4NM32_9PROT|nr:MULTISPECIES: hypothetical protein [Acetobacter]ANA12905.1 hypothetical protein WG31_01805 [Acetobacter oryzifermentans]KAA8387633.1 hypothetical protein FKW31_03020 [Acetobacter sp. DmW_136]
MAISACTKEKQKMPDAINGERPIWVDGKKFYAALKECSIETAGCVPGLLGYGNNGPFEWDAYSIAIFLNGGKDGPVTAEKMESLRPELERFFAPVRGGKWLAPSAEFFCINDPYSEVN